MGVLTEDQRQEVIAARVEGESLRSIARRYGVSPTTIRSYCREDPDLVQKIAQKREETTGQILRAMDARASNVVALMDRYMLELMDDERISSTAMDKLATVLGIILDKWLRAAELTARQPPAAEDTGGVIVLGEAMDGEE